MKVPAFVVLLIAAALAAAAATLSKQDEFLDAVHTSSRRESKYKLIEELLKNPEVDPAANDNAAFLYAVSHDDFFVAQLLLNNPRVDPGAKNGAAILSATSRSNYSMVVLLLSSHRVDPTARGNTAIGNAITKEDVLMMRILLNDDRMVTTEKQAYDILAFAARKFKGNAAPLTMLMNHHKFGDKLIKKLLSVAVSEDRLDLLNWFLTQDKIDPTFDNYSALKAAVRVGQYEVVQRFLTDQRVDAGNNRSYLLLSSISRRDHRLVQILLNDPKVNPSDRDGTFLMEAVEIGDYFILEKLLNRIENPSANGNIALRLALKKKDMKMIRMLFAHPNISFTIPIGYPPFFTALETGELEIVKALAEHPKFAESHPQKVVDHSLRFAEKCNYVEIANYLRTLNVTGNLENRPVSFTDPMAQLEVRLGVLSELIFCSSVDRQFVTTLQAKRELVISKILPLLKRNDLYTNEADSGQGAPSNSGFELLKLTFMDFLTYTCRNMQAANIRDAFNAFVKKCIGLKVEPVANGPPADLKRKREDGQVNGNEANGTPMGEQEPPRNSVEASSSTTPGRNVRRRLNFDDDNGEGGGDKSETEIGVEAGKEPE